MDCCRTSRCSGRGSAPPLNGRSLGRRAMHAQLGPVLLDLVNGWADVTDDVESANDPPWTLAKQSAEACGSLQFSFALYRGGPIPEMSPEELGQFVREFGETHALGKVSDEVEESAPLRLAAATFSNDEWMVRAWYVSDGPNLAKVTYTAGVADDFAAELAECEQMVRTIGFPRVGAAA